MSGFPLALLLALRQVAQKQEARTSHGPDPRNGPDPTDLCKPPTATHPPMKTKQVCNTTQEWPGSRRSVQTSNGDAPAHENEKRKMQARWKDLQSYTGKEGNTVRTDTDPIEDLLARRVRRHFYPAPLAKAGFAGSEGGFRISDAFRRQSTRKSNPQNNSLEINKNSRPPARVDGPLRIFSTPDAPSRGSRGILNPPCILPGIQESSQRPKHFAGNQGVFSRFDAFCRKSEARPTSTPGNR